VQSASLNVQNGGQILVNFNG